MTVRVSLKELLETGAHFGHQAKRWNPRSAPYIYGVQDGVHVFDLTKTKEKLEEALAYLKESARNGKTILFIGTKKQAKDKVESVAKNTGCPYVNVRWLGGTFTNFQQIQKSLRKLSEMKKKWEVGEYKRFTKKERLLIEREIARLKRFFGGIAELESLPDILIVVDTKKESVAVKEAQKVGIEVVGIVDSNANPREVDFPIPMNDDATRAIDYVLGLMEKSIQEGKKKVKKSK